MDLVKQKLELISQKLDTIKSNDEQIIYAKLACLNNDLDMILYYINDLQSTINSNHRDDGDCWRKGVGSNLGN